LQAGNRHLFAITYGYTQRKCTYGTTSEEEREEGGGGGRAVRRKRKKEPRAREREIERDTYKHVKERGLSVQVCTSMSLATCKFTESKRERGKTR